MKRTEYKDATVEERITAGQDMEDYFPNQKPDHDSYSTMFLVGPMRRASIGIPESNGQKYAAQRGDGNFGLKLPTDPDWVVNVPIPDWQYDERVLALVGKNGKIRVFAKEDQNMTLDIDNSMTYMRLGAMLPEDRADLIMGLERELDYDNMDNQRILQNMYRNAQRNDSIIEGTWFKHLNQPIRDPWKMEGLIRRNYNESNGVLVPQ